MDKLLHGQLRFMSTYFEVVAISSDAAYLERVGVREGVRTFPIDMSRKITPLADFLAICKLYFFLRKEKPLLVHSHTPKAGLVAMIASKLAGVPHRLHTVAGLPLMETKGFKRTILNWVEKLTYACATIVYPKSFWLQEIIVQNKFCNLSKLKVIGNGSSNGIDVGYFNPELFTEPKSLALRQHLHIGQSDFVFVFASLTAYLTTLLTSVGASPTLERIAAPTNGKSACLSFSDIVFSLPKSSVYSPVTANLDTSKSCAALSAAIPNIPRLFNIS
jgi:hypothetical protein